ncbi:MAG: hypothetical protein V3W20_02535 [Candidatus Neomarinimicrobiota bacterium]
MFKKVSLVFTILIVGYIIFLIFIPINNNDHLVGVLKFYNDTHIVNPKTVNLTDEGLLDWAHWGFGAEEWTDTAQYTHKAEVSPLINMDTIIVTNKLLNDSPAQVYWYDEPTDNRFKWNDGTPTKIVNNLDAGIWIAGVGNGFRISVPANTKRQFINLYLGAWEARGKLTASLSDNSAPVVISFFEKQGTDYSNNNVRQYTLEFLSSSDNETLTIDWIVEEFYDADGWGNITLRAVTLSN